MTQWGWALVSLLWLCVRVHCEDSFLPDWAFGDITLSERLIGQLQNHAAVFKITEVLVAGAVSDERSYRQFNILAEEDLNAISSTTGCEMCVTVQKI